MTKNQSEIVHEAEAQRRHARVKLPAKLILTSESGRSSSFEILDISAGGFSAKVQDHSTFKHGENYNGVLLFGLNTVEFRLPVSFSVLYRNETQNKMGCEFSNLGRDEISLLRLFISKYVAGELASSGDILSTVNRNNFSKARKQSGSAPLNGWRKFRAVAATGLFGCVGVIAFSYIASNLYNLYFISHANNAMVDVAKQQVLAPTNGNIEIAIDDTRLVKQGQPLAVITSESLAILNKNNSALAQQNDEFKDLLPKQLFSVVKCPVNGKVLAVNVVDHSFGSTGTPLMTIVDENSKPFISAKFKYSEIENLHIGGQVRMSFPQLEGNSFNGKIVAITVPKDSFHDDDIIATIEPDIDIDLERISNPVIVSVESNLLNSLRSSLSFL